MLPNLLQYFSKTREDSGELQRTRGDSDTSPSAEEDNVFNEKWRVIAGLRNPTPRVQVPYSSLPSR